MVSFSSPHIPLCVSLLLFFFSIQSFAAKPPKWKNAPSPAPGPAPKNATPDFFHKTPGPIIEATCSTSKTAYYDLCIHSLRANGEALDSYWDALPKISVAISLNNVTDTQKYIHNLLKRPSDARLKERLQGCKGNYDSATKTIKTSFPYFFSYEFGYVLRNLKDARKEINGCDDGFKKHKGLKYPLKSRNQLSTRLLTIAIDLVQLVDAPPVSDKKTNK